LVVGLLVLGCEAPDPPSAPPPVFKAMTEGDYKERLSHLVALKGQAGSVSADDPKQARANLAAFTEAVVRTAESVIKDPKAPPEAKENAASAALATVYRSIATDADGVGKYLAESQRLEDLGRGTPLVTYVAFERLFGLSDAPERAFKSPEDKFQRVADAVEHLAEVKPPHDEAPTFLIKTAQGLADRGDVKRALKLLTALTDNFPDSFLAPYAAGTRTRLSLPGKVLEDVMGPGADGKPINLEAFRGQFVLLAFWAFSICEPCVKAIPDLAKLRQRYRGRGFEIIGVNVDADVAEARAFIALREIDWPQIMAGKPNVAMKPAHLAHRFGVVELPFYMLVDREGQFVAASSALAVIDKRLSSELEKAQTK
jgi:peroxiredoxin